MATSVHRPLKIEGIGRQCHKQDPHTDVTLLSETRLKPHNTFFIPKYRAYRTDSFPGLQGGIGNPVRNGFAHKHVDLSPLVSVEATGVCIPTGSSKI